VIVQPNTYAPGRANVAVFKWPHQDVVAVDLSGGLPVGSDYEIRNAQNYFGPVVASGRYEGGAISIPMSGLAPAAPIGWTAPAPTGPEFNAFVVQTTQSARTTPTLANRLPDPASPRRVPPPVPDRRPRRASGVVWGSAARPAARRDARIAREAADAQVGFRKERVEELPHRRTVAFAGELLEVAQRALDLLRGIGGETPDQDLGMARLRDVLAGELELLEELLARSQPRERDLHVDVGPQPRQGDHLLREVQDLLSH
jgi:hypothetical protein